MSLSHFTQLLTVFIAQTTQEKPTTLFVFIRYSQLLFFWFFGLLPSSETTTCFCLFSFAYFTHSRRFCSALIMLTKGRPEHDQPSKALIIFSCVHFLSFTNVHPDSFFSLLLDVLEFRAQPIRYSAFFDRHLRIKTPAKRIPERHTQQRDEKAEKAPQGLKYKSEELLCVSMCVVE